jgi:hypothetical protein
MVGKICAPLACLPPRRIEIIPKIHAWSTADVGTVNARATVILQHREAAHRETGFVDQAGPP